MASWWAEQKGAARAAWHNKRQLLQQALVLAMMVCSALAMWRGLMIGTHSESPVIVVLS